MTKLYLFSRFQIKYWTLRYRLTEAYAAFRFPYPEDWVAENNWRIKSEKRNPVVERHLYLKDGIKEARVVETRLTGKMRMLHFDTVGLESFVAKNSKSADESELQERLKKQGIKIGELTKKLKDAQANKN